MVTLFRRSQTFAALLFAGLLGLSLCSLTPRHALAADPDPALGTVTDLLGRKVKVHLPVRRVILGEGRQLYLVAALDTQNPIERIVGWRKDLIQSDPDTYGAYLRKFPAIAKIPTFGGFEDGTFDIEQAISQRPDVIILNIEAQHATEFYNSPYQFAAIQQLAKWFHPTLFADLDPDASLRELHERFLPVPYEPGYFVSLDKPEVKQ
ncbi:TroA family protein [Pseudomonas sp. MDT2-39-1]|uniref:hypothetical protein n=1 Tax=Pseudomonas sp. BGI-2 TaxID=2528211 RepID=UPI0010347A38|nr:hypothetical protein [Pseudomonas sp. BGI-2]TBN31567.1 hypothetical protein EYC95_29680 [Pseudomonas sp. BGI-2]